MKIDDNDLREFFLKIVVEQNQLLLNQIKELLPKLEEKYYSVQQIAKKLELHKQTVYKLINQGKLNVTKTGNRNRITESDLNLFLSTKNNYVIKKRRKFKQGLLIQNSQSKQL